MKVFSPSQTKSYLKCPFYWQLGRQWMPRTWSKMNLYAARGSGVSVGLETFNRGASDDEIIDAVNGEVAACWEKDQLDFREWHDFRTEPQTMGDMQREALQLVEAYINNPPTAFTVIESEYIFREHGNCRPDVIAQVTGDIMPVDYKVKNKPSTQWLRSAILGDFKDAWQLLHYCWAIEEEFNVECLDYIICILWFSKTPSYEVIPYTVKPERAAHWIASARVIWEQMEEIAIGGALPHEVDEHGDKFGPCVFKDACLVGNRDPDYMEEHFIQIER